MKDYKKNLIFVGSLLIMLVLLSIICFFMPTIEFEVNGNKNITINVGDEYQDLGAKAYLKSVFKKEELKVDTYNSINSNKVGKYIVTYKANYFWLNKETSRIVNVSDIEKPVLSISDDIKYCKINNLVSLNVMASDNIDGNISDRIKYKIDNEKITISVSDSSNNISEITKNLVVIDYEKPIITLKGNNTIYLSLGEKYSESGAIAYDSCDGDISKNITITNNINENSIGIYEVIYKVSDSYGNTVTKARQVIVKNTEESNHKVKNGATIYLTFDDGPGPYTEDILSTLDKYNIKATFFVTNQFPKYQYLIGKEYKKGHTVGVHTYTHKWSVYDSVDAYLNDFNKMKDIIINETGISPKYFRFPGGSSNTVSRSHSKGIMTKLAKLMQDNGYVYFDWTFDSGDTSRNDNSKEAIIKNFKNRLKGDGEYIVLMHDIKKNTMFALEEVIKYGLANGYTFKAIDDNTSVVHLKIAN